MPSTYLYYIKCNTPALHTYLGICIVMYQTTIGYKHKYFFILDTVPICAT